MRGRRWRCSFTIYFIVAARPSLPLRAMSGAAPYGTPIRRAVFAIYAYASPCE